ncbi:MULTISPECIES: VENN motif pre-toxin domain-containing protein, partial [unclassified Providencia]|uniref:VENN motif pre-toxin domain-containing protein n=1 Tax=unclassified Providencia TaxID=2633465 RepID=UPI0013228EF1
GRLPYLKNDKSYLGLQASTYRSVYTVLIQAEINQSGWGVGGDKRRIVESGTALIQGLVNGDVNKAVANASAQSLGTVTAEAVGMLSEKLYGKAASQLTEDEKATVSAFASLAAGIAGGLVGGDTSSAANAGQAGKTTVENNTMSGAGLGGNLGFWLADIKDCDQNCKAEIAKGINDGNLETSGHAAGVAGLGLYSGTGLIVAGIGGSANYLIQLSGDKPINYTDVLIAAHVGGITKDSNFYGVVGWNAFGGGLSSELKGEDPLLGAGTTGISSGIGHGLGGLIKWGSNKWKYVETKGLDPKYNPRLQGGANKGQLGLSKDLSPAKGPSVAGNVTSSVVTEKTNSRINDEIKNDTGK